jgi:hypothetical protein
LELPFCNKDPGKVLAFAMLPLGRPAGAGCRNPARPARFLAEEGAEEGPRESRGRFGSLLGLGRRPARGAPVASGGGRRELGCGAAGAQLRAGSA